MKIIKGDKLLCLKDNMYYKSDTKAYIKGHEYTSEVDDCITDEYGNKEHRWNCGWDDADSYFKKIDNSEKTKDNVFVYYHGNKERGDEIVKALEELGGKNYSSLKCDNIHNNYCLNEGGIICSRLFCEDKDSWFKTHYTEAFLPEKEINKPFYYRGNLERGGEIIMELEKLGGRNLFGRSGNAEELFYYINSDGIIDTQAVLSDKDDKFFTLYTERHLPEIENQRSISSVHPIYYRGDKERGKEIIEELERMGGQNILDLSGENIDRLYFIDINDAINYGTCEDNWVKEQASEAHLPNKSKDNVEFDAFDKVLYKSNNSKKWSPQLYYVLLDNKGKLPDSIQTVIPYNDETKHLKYTELEAPKKYKNYE